MALSLTYVLYITLLLDILTPDFATRTDYGYPLRKYSHGTTSMQAEETPASSEKLVAGLGCTRLQSEN